MAIKNYKPTTPGRRGMSVLSFDEITTNKPEKSLLAKKTKNAGRSKGKITVRHQGGGEKRKYRIIDFKRNKKDIYGTVASIEYDPNRSANIALSYLKANYKFYNINYDMFNNDIHIHVPEGAIKKDGPSAGIALTLAILSALTKTKISNTLALTGEITLRGQVLAIGGLKEKTIGALRSGIKTIIIPYENTKDLEELPPEVKDNINFIKVKNFKEIYKVIKNA